MHASRSGQGDILKAAAAATDSEGWASDAVGWALSPAPGQPPVALAVFQRFEGSTAELHFAMLEGRRLSRRVIESLEMLAFHPMAHNLSRVFAVVPEKNRACILAVLRCGFDFQYRKPGGVADGSDAIVLMRWAPERTPTPVPAKPIHIVATATEEG